MRSFEIVLAPSSIDRKSTRLNSSHQIISYAVFCLKSSLPPRHLHSFPTRRSSDLVQQTVEEDPHEQRARVPSAHEQATVDRALRSLLVDMERLRIELSGEGEDAFLRDRPGPELDHVPRREILEVAHRQERAGAGEPIGREAIGSSRIARASPAARNPMSAAETNAIV